MAAKLRVAKPGERSVKKFASVEQAAVANDRLAEMEQMRLVIARAIDNENTSARDLAALTKREIEISKEIDAEKRRRVEEGDGVIDSKEAPFDASAI